MQARSQATGQLPAISHASTPYTGGFVEKSGREKERTRLKENLRVASNHPCCTDNCRTSRDHSHARRHTARREDILTVDPPSPRHKAHETGHGDQWKCGHQKLCCPPLPIKQNHPTVAARGTHGNAWTLELESTRMGLPRNQHRTKHVGQSVLAPDDVLPEQDNETTSFAKWQTTCGIT